MEDDNDIELGKQKIKILQDFEDNENELDLLMLHQTKEEKEIIANLDLLEEKIIKYINIELNINITGNEQKLDLSYKKIDDNTLNLITGIQFKNLEELDLNHNNIIDAKIIKNLNLKKLKKLDLSFNKINKIKEYSPYTRNKKINI